MSLESFIKKIRNYSDGSLITMKAEAEEYYVTGIQVGNINGEMGWHKYLGYIAQIREKAGLGGSDLFLMRHPNGTLTQHHNQFFYKIPEDMKEEALSFFEEGVAPDQMEDYNEFYYLGSNNEYPAKGKVVPPGDTSPYRSATLSFGLTVSKGETNEN